MRQNLESLSDFQEVGNEFLDRRPQYDLGLYYAGHGLQVAGRNYLLPTAEQFDSERAVTQRGFSVGSLIDYLDASDGLNLIILDACRNNPFEGNWSKERSIGGSSGLAKIDPPSGLLVAFSTDAGRVALDGDGGNSVYCKSLSENMKLVDTPIEQVFKNVREEVERETNNRQSPVEMQKLTGSALYLKKSDFKDQLDLADESIPSGR